MFGGDLQGRFRGLGDSIRLGVQLVWGDSTSSGFSVVWGSSVGANTAMQAFSADDGDE